jgi:hypothetical protein
MVNPKSLGIVATMVKLYGNELIATHKLHWELLKSNGYEFFNAFIRESSGFAAPDNNLMIFSKLHADIVKELREFGDEFIKKAMI